MADPALREPRYEAALAHLGERDSLRYLATPALYCDLEALDANIARMSERARVAGVGLRPHVKTHKSAFVARKQLEAGAVGLAFAKLSEAEAVVRALHDDGYDEPLGVLVTSPLVGTYVATRAARLASLARLMVAVDSVNGVDELAEALSGTQVTLEVLIDVDVGQRRSGVDGADQALEVSRRVARYDALHFVGVQGYAGHVQHVHGAAPRDEANRIATLRLGEAIEVLESSGFSVPVRTGGGTGSVASDTSLDLLNELQCGSYVFMDRQYRDALGEDVDGRFAQSLFIATTVVSTNHQGYATVDAGWKSMATEAGAPLVVGHEATGDFRFHGDEHGLVQGDFARGERLALIPPHCDPTVDKYDVLWLTRGDVLVGAAPIVARGHSQ